MHSSDWRSTTITEELTSSCLRDGLLVRRHRDTPGHTTPQVTHWIGPVTGPNLAELPHVFLTRRLLTPADPGVSAGHRPAAWSRDPWLKRAGSPTPPRVYDHSL